MYCHRLWYLRFQHICECLRYYYSYHPGKEGFEEVYGHILKNEDFEMHEVKIENTNKINLRSEQVDDTIVLFLQNGTSTAKNITINISLFNMNASKNIPYEINIAAETEKYALLLKPIKGALSVSYSASMSYYELKWLFFYY